jgi:predicted lipid-binding transport protein (Tim44 family)
VELGSRHPNEQYKTHWLPLAFAHWFGHILFGAALGSMISAFLIGGTQGFLIACFVNLLIAGGLTLMARKNEILSH